MALWPHWPLAIVLCIAGIQNIVEALHLPWAIWRHLREINQLPTPLSAFRGTAQLILGSMLVLAGIGLARKLRLAWSLAVILLLLLIGMNVARQNWAWAILLQAVLLGLLLVAARWFTRRTVIGSLLLSLSSIVAVIAYGTCGSYLMGTGFKPPIQDLSSAVYFTIITLSTVGYGDIVPISSDARWFVMSLVVVGLGIFTTTVASVLGPKISQEIQRVFHRKEKPMEMNNHVILSGNGAIARNTAKELERRGIPCVRILADGDQNHGEEPQGIEGEAVTDALLQRAGIGSAKMIIAAGEDDGENAFLSLTAKDLNPKVAVMAVASSPMSIRRLKLARADIVFSPAAVGSRLLADMVEGGKVSQEFRDLVQGDLST
ncbi:MAG TPA: NAD-binding protein [Tepidisphaeraceae bacterium]|nr:NAD-binding protein [Tepidisphaeraceae bacterium]